MAEKQYFAREWITVIGISRDRTVLYLTFKSSNVFLPPLQEKCRRDQVHTYPHRTYVSLKICTHVCFCIVRGYQTYDQHIIT